MQTLASRWDVGGDEFAVLMPGTDADIAGVNIPTGIPLVYRLDGNLRPVVPGGEYLDPDAAATAAAAVAAQGKA